jgi:hypothetical protein
MIDYVVGSVGGFRGSTIATIVMLCGVTSFEVGVLPNFTKRIFLAVAL